MRIVLIDYGQVVEDIFPAFVHSMEPVLNDNGKLKREGRIVSLEIRDRVGEQMAMPILVLEALARQCCPASRSANEKPFGAAVCCGPDKVADALETEHGIEDKEGNNTDSMACISGSCSNER